MASKYARKALSETPDEIRQFAINYGNLTCRIQEILENKGINQKELAILMDKRESEISKWLSDKHNLTLKSISKMEAVLKETILYIPQQRQVNIDRLMTFSTSSLKNRKSSSFNFQLCKINSDSKQLIYSLA